MSRSQSMRRRAGASNRGKHRRPKIQAAVEAMEMRLVLSTFVVNTFVIVAAPANIVVNTTKDQTDPTGSKTVSLRDAVARNGGPVNITFDPKVFARNQVITLQGSGLELANAFGPVNIVGPAAGVTVVGDGTDATMTVDSHVTADFSGLTIENGYAYGVDSNGGVVNHGNLTITGSTIANNVGGIQNDGDLTLRASTVSGNSIIRDGGGLFNSGVATVANCTFSDNSADAAYHGEGGTSPGGAIDNTGMLTLTNSTLTGNSAGAGGGGLYNLGTASVSDCTITANSAESSYGGGIANGPMATLTIANSILTGNTAYAGGNDAYGAITSRGHNLVGQTDGSIGWIASDLKGRVFHPIDPRLSPLGNYGGPTQTQFPLAGSPAIGLGSAALIPTGDATDQRGYARIVGGKVDIGAVELQKAAVVTVAPPAVQHVTAGVATPINLGSFSDPGGKGPFTVDVNWGDGSPVSIYSANNSGKLGTHTHAFIDTGSLTGTILVIDGAGDVSQFAGFSISSAVAPAVTLVVNTTGDRIDSATSKTVSLRDAIDRADASFGPVTITFDPAVFAAAQTVTLDDAIGRTLDLFKNRFGAVTVIGPAAGMTVNGAVMIGAGITASLDRITLQDGGIANGGTLVVSNGVITGASTPFGAVENDGTMMLTACTISGNTAFSLEGNKGGIYDGNGGGIDNGGTMTIVDCTISGNTAEGAGGGIYNSSFQPASMTIVDSTISGNTSDTGGGIFNAGSLKVTGSTVWGNKVNYGPYDLPGEGGGIYNSATLTLTNSTVAGNSADHAGGINNATGGKATIADSTISGNSSTTGAGGIDNTYGDVVMMANTIVAANHGGVTVPDVAGKFKSLGHNLIGKTNHSTGWIAADLTGSIGHPLDAKLSPLGDHGGSTRTLVPLAGSPALAAGSVSLIPTGVTTDQRGLPRVVAGKVDIGAVETGD